MVQVEADAVAYVPGGLGPQVTLVLSQGDLLEDQRGKRHGG